MAHFKLQGLVERIATTATAAGTTTLLNNSRTYQQFTGSTTQTVVLPDATTLSVGMKFVILNRSSGAVTVNYNGGSLAAAVAAGAQKTFRVTDISTSAGTWDVSNEAASGGGASLTAADQLAAVAALSAQNYQDSSNIAIKVEVNPEDVSGNYWLQKASLNTGQYRNAAFTLNGFGYQAGGQSSALVERYDDVNNFWLSRSSLASANQGDLPATFDLNGFGYQAGGNFITTTAKYTDSTDSWATVGALPVALGQTTGYSLGGYGFTHCGASPSNGTNITTLYAYSDGNNAWYSRGNVAITGRDNGKAVVLNDSAIAFGGRDAGLSATHLSEKYNYVTNNVSAITSHANDHIHAGGFSILGFSYVMSDNSGSLVAERYTDFTNTWLTVAPTLIDHNGNKGFSVNEAGYQAGTGATGTRMDKYVASTLFSFNLNKRSKLVPTSVFASVALADLVVDVPVQVRTDTDNWKTLTSNSDSFLKLNESVRAKLPESALGYVFGGDDAVSVFRTAVEFYNDSANTWVVRTSLATARGYFGGFRLRGLGYIVSGQTGGGLVATVLAYDDVSDSFTSKASISSARQFANGFLLKDYGYITGGGAPVTTVERYDAALDSWSARGSLTTARTDHAAWVQNERGYVNQGVGNSTEQYSDITNTWTTKTVSSNSLSRKLAFAYNGYGYSSCGVSPSSAHERYNDQANSWSTLTSLNANRSYGSGWYQNGYGYAAGGAQGSTPLSSSEQFNDAANTWTNKASMGTSRQAITSGISPGAYRNYEVRVGIPAFMAGAGAGVWVTRTSKPTAGTNDSGCASYNGFIYSHGGRNGGSVTNVTEQYSDSSGAWVFKANGNNIQSGPSVGVLGAFMYYARGAAANAVEKYEDVTNAWSSVTSTSTSASGTAGASVNGFFYTTGGGGTTTIEQYNQQTNAWSSKTGMTTARGNHGCSSLNSFLYVVNGDTNIATEQYNDVSNSWTTKATPANQHDNTAAVAFAQGIHSSGGSVTPVTEVYIDITNLWVLKSSNPAGSGKTGRGSHVVLNNNMYLAGFQTSTNYDGLYQLSPSLNSIVLGLGLRVIES